MTKEELEIGAKWLSILNANSDDFSTKSLFNQTASYLKTIQTGGAKKVSRFQKETKTPVEKQQRSLLKPMSLQEAAKAREEKLLEDDEPSNLLVIDESGNDEIITKKGRKK